MSVTTTADERLDLAKFHLACALDHLRESRNALDEAFGEDTWGHDTFTEGLGDKYIAQLEHVCFAARLARAAIGSPSSGEIRGFSIPSREQNHE